MKELGEALFKALIETTDRPRFGQVYWIRLETSDSELRAWVEGTKGKVEWKVWDEDFTGSSKAVLWMGTGFKDCKLSLRNENEHLYIFDETYFKEGNFGLRGQPLTGSPPPLTLSLRRLTRFFKEVADLLGPTSENPPFREVGENLALLASLLEEHGEDLGLFAKGPFRLARGREGAVLWNAETHELGPALEELLRRGTYEGPLPGWPQLKVRLALEDEPKRPWRLSVRPLALEVGGVAFSPREPASARVFRKADEQRIAKDLLEAFGIRGEELDLLKREGPEALAKALALRRVAEL